MKNDGKLEFAKNQKFNLYLQREISEKTWVSTAHYHDALELCFYIKGMVTCWVNGVAYAMQENEILFIDGNAVHYFELDKGSEYIAIRIGEEFLQVFEGLTKEHENRTGFPILLDKKEENKILFEIAECFLNDAENLNILKVHGYVNFLLGEIQRSYSCSKKENSSKDKEILLYIHEHICDDVSLHALAKHFGYNEKVLSRKIHSLLGQDLRNYVNYIRIAKAIELREKYPQLSVSDVAYRMGFKSMNTFYRARAKFNGLSNGTDTNNFYI